MPRFFMSHSRADDGLTGDDLVQELFKSLVGQIAQGVQDAPETVGYLDTANLEMGDDWSDELAHAVCSSAVFVPILTARYFTRPYCGREWQLFEDRCAAIAQNGRLPPLIVPILWMPPLEGAFPDFATSLHFAPSANDFSDEDAKLLPEFTKRGLVHVIKNRNARFNSFYGSLIEALAAKIVALGNAHPLPALPRNRLPRLGGITPRFPLAPRPAATSSSPGGVPVAHFAYLAADAQAGSGVRTNGPMYYRGPNGGGWYPYAPESNKPIALLAQRAAVDRELVAQVFDIDAQLPAKIRAAEARREPVILIVDPWSAARLPDLGDKLANFDQYQFANCAVLIAWDFFGARMPAERDELQGKIKEVLGRRFQAGHPALLREQIQDPGSLTRQLTEALSDLEVLLAPLRDNRRPISSDATSLPPSISPVVT